MPQSHADRLRKKRDAERARRARTSGDVRPPSSLASLASWTPSPTPALPDRPRAYPIGGGVPVTPPPVDVPAGLALDVVDLAALSDGEHLSALELLDRWRAALRAWAVAAGVSTADLRRAGQWPELDDVTAAALSSLAPRTPTAE